MGHSRSRAPLATRARLARVSLDTSTLFKEYEKSREIRDRAIQAAREEGMTFNEIAAATGLSKTMIEKITKRRG